MEEKNVVIAQKNILANIKSKYILKKICNYITEIKLLKIIKINKSIQNLLNKELDDYKKNAKIIINIVPHANKNFSQKKWRKFINISDEKYFKIYFNDSPQSTKIDKIEGNGIINQIKIELNNNIKSLDHLFTDCLNIDKITFTRFSIRDITNMNKMFSMCFSLQEINFVHFETEFVTNMQGMFFGCGNLIELNLSNFNTINVTNMAHMFYRCGSLKKLTLSNLITKNCSNMSNMFKGCTSLEKLDLSNFDTHNVTDMSEMFLECAGLTELNISKFDTKNVTNMYAMFKGCKNLNFLDISNFIINENAIKDEMFYDCSSLEKLILPSYLKKKKKKPKEINRIFYYCNKLKKENVIYKGEEKKIEQKKNCICF